MHRTIQAVIFDCDGTLVDSEPAGFAGITDAAASVGLRLDHGDELLALKGRSMAQVLQLLDGLHRHTHGQPLPDDFEPVVRAAMLTRFHQMVQPMPGARTLLPWLQQQGIPYCVASNGPRQKMLQTLTISGLLRWCEDRLISAYEVGVFKPDPGLLLHAAQTLGVPPQACAMVEDSAPGVQAGLAAGMQVHVMRSPDPLPAELAAQVNLIDSLAQLQQLRFAAPG